MFSINRLISLCVLLALGGAAACTTYQTYEANKLVESSQAVLNLANESAEKANTGLEKMNRGVDQAENENDLEDLQALAKQVIADYEKARDGYKEGASKFEAASKMRLQDKQKEYYELRGKELIKRSEVMDAVMGEPKGLLESNSVEEYRQKATTVIQKIHSLNKEADELKGKADTILAENKGMFKE